MQKLKIGFVLDDSLDSTDGVQQYILTLGNWLENQGHEVHYLVGQTTRTDKINVHSLSRNIAVRFNANRLTTPLPASKTAIHSLLQAEKFDVLHVQIPYSPWLAHRVIMAAKLETVIVGTFHVAPYALLMSVGTWLLASITRRSIRRFDRFYAVSSAASQFAQKTYAIKTHLLPNVVEVERFRTAKPYARYSNKPTIVFLGRLVERKGCQTLLEAAAKLKTYGDVPAFRIVICGRGPLQPSLEQYVVQHDLADVVEFAGYISEDDKPRYLSSADIAVFPSTGGECFGIVLIEAMAANYPVVLGADNEGYKTVLEDHPTSLFPIKDAVSLANKLHIYLTNINEQKAARDWQNKTLAQYDVAFVGQKLVTEYTELLRSKDNT